MFSVAKIFNLQGETGRFAAERSAHVIEQVKGARGDKADGACGLHNLRLGSGGRSVLWRGWGRLFWLVWWGRRERRDLMAIDER